MKSSIILLFAVTSIALFAADIRLDGPASDWNVVQHEGAKGSMTEVAKGVYRITKENADGVLELRMKMPVEIPGPRRWFLRSEFQYKGHSPATMFFFRLPLGPTAPPNFHPSGSRTAR